MPQFPPKMRDIKTALKNKRARVLHTDGQTLAIQIFYSALALAVHKMFNKLLKINTSRTYYQSREVAKIFNLLRILNFKGHVVEFTELTRDKRS